VNNGYGAYHQLLRSGIRPAPVGNSDSHGTLNDEVGYPRVYIQSSKDNPAELDPAELARNMKRGMVSVTNGPFVELTVNGQGAGSLVTDTDGNVDLALEVFAANWVNVQAIGINLNGRFVRQILLPPAQAGRQGGRVFPDPGAEVEPIRIPVDRDAVLDIVVQGGEGSNMDPVNPFNPPLSSRAVGRGQMAMAFSAPIYIDADGDGLLTITDEDAAQTPMPTIEDPNDPPF
jgi:hypothetical protein